MDETKQLIRELKKTAHELNRDTTLHHVADLLIAAANMLAEDESIIKHLKEELENKK